ncbi:hypothetical protein N8917_00785 [bacterium]|nr:hypothetical protein [bacterium]
MGRYRRIETEEELLFRSADDKRFAFNEINEKNHQEEGGDPYAIPYFLTGRKSQDTTPPTYRSGRLHTNSSGQTRHYLDWIVAEESSSLLSLTEL